MATPIPPNRARLDCPTIADVTGGAIVQRGAIAAVGITTDSRAVVKGGVFVALRGEKHDGHAFAAGAVERGAAIVVVERGRAAGVTFPREVSVVEVDDSLVAWGALAGRHLDRWREDAVDGRVIAITGSAGKTTTKELTAALLGAIGSTHYTAGNLNNRIGVPAVLFALEPSHRFCVLEMGMSLPGELDAITSFARPDVGVVVNVGVAHAEGVGGQEGVMREKGAVYRALGRDGIAVVNADDEYVRRAVRGTKARRVETFGRSTTGRPSGMFVPAQRDSVPPAPPSSPAASGAHYRLVDRRPEGSGSRVVLSCAGRDLEVFLPLPGEAAALDLCAAIATQEAASREVLSAPEIEAALATISLEGRGTVRRLPPDLLVLDDTYNANPASMRAALETLAEIAGGRRRVAVLGEMKELGALAEEEHAALGDAIAEAGVTLAIGCGGLVDLALDRAAARGVEVVKCASTDDAAKVTKDRVREGDAVLVKGSRSVAAERVVAALG